jgi:hypothetical protein
MNPEYSSVNAGASIISFASSNNKRLQGTLLFSLHGNVINHSYVFLLEMDRFTIKEFRRLANTEPESGVSYCPGVQYYGIDDAPGEDCHWVRDLFQDVSVDTRRGNRQIKRWVVNNALSLL